MSIKHDNEKAAEEFVVKRCNEDDDPIFWKGEMHVAFCAGCAYRDRWWAEKWALHSGETSPSIWLSAGIELSNASKEILENEK